MQVLSQSSFLQALGYAIANSLWQVGLLWLALLFINALFTLSSHNRYRVAITAQLAGFACFAGTLQYYYAKCNQANASVQNGLTNSDDLYSPEIMESSRWAVLSFAKAESLLPYLSVAYLCMLSVMAVRWFNSYRHAHHLKHNELQNTGFELASFVQQMAARLGIQQPVKVYISRLATSPLTVGFLKPVILVPVATLAYLSPQQLEAVLLHELAHIRRADYLVNLLLNVVETILFFNPFTRIIGQQINKEREHCCDDWVIQFNYNAAMYAEALLRLACLQAKPGMAMKAEGKNKSELTWRVKRLLHQQQKSSNYSQQMVALLVATCLLAVIAWIQPNQRPINPLENTTALNLKAPHLNTRSGLSILSPFSLLTKEPEAAPKTKTEILKIEAAWQSVMDKSMVEANVALQQAIPEAMQQMEKMANDSTLENELTNATKELETVNWQILSPFVDSAEIIHAVRSTIPKTHFSAQIAQAQQSLAEAKRQLEQLRKHHTAAILRDQRESRTHLPAQARIAGMDKLQVIIKTKKAFDDSVAKHKSYLMTPAPNMRESYRDTHQPKMQIGKNGQPAPHPTLPTEIAIFDDAPFEWDAPNYFVAGPVVAMPNWEDLMQPPVLQKFALFNFVMDSPEAPVPPPPPAAPAVYRFEVSQPEEQVNVIITIVQ